MTHKEEGGSAAANPPKPSLPTATMEQMARFGIWGPELWEDWTYFAAPFGYDKVRIKNARAVLAEVRQRLPKLCIHTSLEYEGLTTEPDIRRAGKVMDFFGVPPSVRDDPHNGALHLCHRMAERARNLIYITDPNWYPQRTSYGVAAECAIARNLGKDVFELTGHEGHWHLEVKFSKNPTWLAGFPLPEFPNYLRTQNRT